MKKTAIHIALTFAAALNAPPVSPDSAEAQDSVADIGYDAHYVAKSLKEIRAKMVKDRAGETETYANKAARQRTDKGLKESCRVSQPAVQETSECLETLKLAHIATMAGNPPPTEKETERLEQIGAEINSLTDRFSALEESISPSYAPQNTEGGFSGPYSPEACDAARQVFEIIGDKNLPYKDVWDRLTGLKIDGVPMSKEHAELYIARDPKAIRFTEHILDNCPKPGTP